MNKDLVRIKYQPNTIQVKRDNILRLLGYQNAGYEPAIADIVDNQIQQAQALISPEGGFVVQKLDSLDVKKGWLKIKDTVFEINRIIASQLRETAHIAIFACTIGNKLEKHSKAVMSKGDALEGYILDLMGSEAAEQTASAIHQNIVSTAEKNGLGHTNRFSPGYCNWDVREQFKLFGFFPDGFCGIKLTESALMNPIKSVSGIVGLGKKAKFREYNCSLCNDENCLYRNRK